MYSLWHIFIVTLTSNHMVYKLSATKWNVSIFSMIVTRLHSWVAMIDDPTEGKTFDLYHVYNFTTKECRKHTNWGCQFVIYCLIFHRHSSFCSKKLWKHGINNFLCRALYWSQRKDDVFSLWILKNCMNFEKDFYKRNNAIEIAWNLTKWWKKKI